MRYYFNRKESKLRSFNFIFLAFFKYIISKLVVILPRKSTKVHDWIFFNLTTSYLKYSLEKESQQLANFLSQNCKQMQSYGIDLSIAFKY